MSIGQRLKDIRKSKGYSQDALAESLGCSRGVITNIERDLTTPTTLIANAICDILDINSEWLITGDGDINKNDDLSEKAKITSEIYSLAKELSEDEQLYILDVINTFKKHKDHLKLKEDK